MELKFNEVSVKYHDIFDYKLTKDEAVRWQYQKYNLKVSGKKNKTRLQREKYSKNKFKLAKKASILISKIPTVLFVSVTGALAMNNAGENSDIDLMIITKTNTLWTTRFLVYVLLGISGYRLRKPKQKNEKDKLCINLWMDENDLEWDKKDRNIYTAHEIAQIVPLVDKEKIYEKFIWKNKWITDFWPNSVSMSYAVSSNLNGIKPIKHKTYNIWQFFEKLFFKIQYQYMKSKITREIVTPTRAIFHPNDWGKVVIDKLKNY